MRTAAKYNRNIPDVLPTTYYIPQDFGMWYSEACRHKCEWAHVPSAGNPASSSTEFRPSQRGCGS